MKHCSTVTAFTMDKYYINEIISDPSWTCILMTSVFFFFFAFLSIYLLSDRLLLMTELPWNVYALSMDVDKL